MTDISKALQDTPIAQLLNAEEMGALASALTSQTIKPGENLFAANDPGDALFIVLQGTLDVTLGGAGEQNVVARIGAGQIVGELEVITHSRRVATLTAHDEAHVLALPAATFHAMVEANSSVANKLVMNIAKVLARRLASVNQRIIDRSHAPASSPVAAATAPEAHAAAASEAQHHPAEMLGDDDLAMLDKLWS